MFWWVVIGTMGLVVALAASVAHGWRHDLGWSKWVVLGLLIALVASYVERFYQVVDSGSLYADRNAECTQEEEALAESLKIVRLAKGQRLRKEMIAAAQTAIRPADRDISTFEKGDGLIVVGALGLRFDPEGALIDVDCAWSPSVCEDDAATGGE
jgi:hypothetical protein